MPILLPDTGPCPIEVSTEAHPACSVSGGSEGKRSDPITSCIALRSWRVAWPDNVASYRTPFPWNGIAARFSFVKIPSNSFHESGNRES